MPYATCLNQAKCHFLHKSEVNILKNHPLIKSLLNLRGNPRACIFTEPLWGIPYFLFLPFVSVYMSALSLTDKQIGLVASIMFLSRAVFAFLGGAITDKMGRKNATFLMDLFAWSIPALLWTFSQNFWWFIIAAVFNGVMQITDNSWNCLLVEDAEKSQIVNMYSWVHISGQLAIFFAPLSGLLVNKLTLVPAMRIIYFFAFVSMSAKFIVLFKYCDETKTGMIRKSESHGMSIFNLLSGYGEIAKKILGSTEMLIALALNALFAITTGIMTNFFGLYTTKNLMIPEYYLSIFPIIRSAILLCFMFFLQPAVSKYGYKIPMVMGIVLYTLSHVFLLLSPAGSDISVIYAIAYTVLEACAHCLVIPRRDSIMVLFIDKRERARIISIMTMAVFAINIPFGYLSGYLSDINRRLPFILNTALFVVTSLVIILSRNLSAKNMSHRESGS